MAKNTNHARTASNYYFELWNDQHACIAFLSRAAHSKTNL